MGHPLSLDLRTPLLAAIDEGLSCRAVAARFGVAPATSIRWETRRETGSFGSKPQGGDARSRCIEERASDILAIWEARKDVSLKNCALLSPRGGLTVWVARLHRFFARRDMTR